MSEELNKSLMQAIDKMNKKNEVKTTPYSPVRTPMKKYKGSLVIEQDGEYIYW